MIIRLQLYLCGAETNHSNLLNLNYVTAIQSISVCVILSGQIYFSQIMGEDKQTKVFNRNDADDWLSVYFLDAQFVEK